MDLVNLMEIDPLHNIVPVIVKPAAQIAGYGGKSLNQALTEAVAEDIKSFPKPFSDLGKLFNKYRLSHASLLFAWDTGDEAVIKL